MLIQWLNAQRLSLTSLFQWTQLTYTKLSVVICPLLYVFFIVLCPKMPTKILYDELVSGMYHGSATVGLTPLASNTVFIIKQLSLIFISVVFVKPFISNYMFLPLFCGILDKSAFISFCFLQLTFNICFTVTLVFPAPLPAHMGLWSHWRLATPAYLSDQIFMLCKSSCRYYIIRGYS